MEDENERMTEELKDKIYALKSLSIDIGTEVKYQDKMLKGMVSWPVCLRYIYAILHITLNIRNNMNLYFRMMILKGQVVPYLVLWHVFCV